MSSVLCCDEKCVYQDAEWDPNTPGSYPIIGATKAEGENMVAHKLQSLLQNRSQKSR